MNPLLPAVMLAPAEPELGVTAHAAMHGVVGNPQGWQCVPLLHSLPGDVRGGARGLRKVDVGHAVHTLR